MESLEDQSSFFGKITLSYLNPLLRLGATRPLTKMDLGGPSEQDKAANTFDSVKRIYDSMPEDKRSIMKALFRGFGKCKFFYALTLQFISVALGFIPVLILNDLVEYFQTEQAAKTTINPWLEVVALLLVPVLMTLLQAQSQVTMSHAAVYVRTAVSLLIYEKILKISSSGRAKTSTGAIVNMMSNDTTQLQRFIQFSNMVLTAPFTVGVSLYLIYQQVSFSEGRSHELL